MDGKLFMTEWSLSTCGFCASLIHPCLDFWGPTHCQKNVNTLPEKQGSSLASIRPVFLFPQDSWGNLIRVRG